MSDDDQEDARRILLTGRAHEMFMVLSREEDGLTLIRESEVPAPPTWLTRELTARSIHAYDIVGRVDDGIRYYSPMVPPWVACIYRIAKCRLQKPVLSSNVFFEVVTQVAERPELHDAIIAADDVEFVWELLKQQGLIKDQGLL